MPFLTQHNFACVAVLLISTVFHGNASAATETSATPTLITGLEAPGEILIDKWGIPHIYAQSERDAYFLQGFNAARDRLWQIDLWRRRGLGLLSQTYGEAFLPNDTAARLFLYRGDVAQELDAYGPDGKSALTAFVSGINAFIDRARSHPEDMPKEFSVAGYEPQHWEVGDLVKIRAHGIALNAAFEIQRAMTLCTQGETAESLRVRLQPSRPLNPHDDIDLCAIPPEVVMTYASARRSLLNASDMPGGSNNWAVSASRSATGRAVVANDPHRAIGLPSLRYLVHVTTPDLSFAGATEPFAPGVSIGHNGHVAFGLTVQFVDQEDVYVYELHPDDPTRYRYLDGWEEMVEVVEDIPVRGKEPVATTLLFTRHGPVMHLDLEKRRAYAVRTMQLETGMAPYLGSLNFLKSKTVADAMGRLVTWGGPGENMVFGDTAGDIAWQVAAFVPQRPNWDGLLPVPGSGDYEWNGVTRSDELPSSVNPKTGIIVTANEMNSPPEYPTERYKTGFEFVDPARAQRISEVLTASEKIPFETHLTLQLDEVSIPAREAVGRLSRIDLQDTSAEALVQRFDGWDYALSSDSEAAALYALWVRDHLPAAIYLAIVGETMPPGFEFHMIALRAVLNNPLAESQGKVSDAQLDSLMLESLQAASAALAQVAKDSGVDPMKLTWGDLQKVTLSHPIEDLVAPDGQDCAAAKNKPAGGSQHTVNVAYSGPDFVVKAASAPRIVMDVGAWDNTQIANIPGQSGEPTSPFYCDLAAGWLAGEYFPLLFSRTAVESATVKTLRFEPGD